MQRIGYADSKSKLSFLFLKTINNRAKSQVKLPESEKQ